MFGVLDNDMNDAMKERADTDVSGEEHWEAGINKSELRRMSEPRKFNSDSL